MSFKKGFPIFMIIQVAHSKVMGVCDRLPHNITVKLGCPGRMSVLLSLGEGSLTKSGSDLKVS